SGTLSAHPERRIPSAVDHRTRKSTTNESKDASETHHEMHPETTTNAHNAPWTHDASFTRTARRIGRGCVISPLAGACAARKPRAQRTGTYSPRSGERRYDASAAHRGANRS